MATGGEIKSSTDEFEGRKHPCCSPCSDDGGYTAAGHYCVNCEMYFCGKCVKFHKTIPVLKSHQVNDVENPDLTNADNEIETTRSVSSETPKCPLHHKYFDTFCKDHDDVCCGTCARVKHRLCSIESIATSVKDFNCSVEGNETKSQLNSLMTSLEHEMKKRIDNLNGIETKKLEHIENIDKYEEEIVAKIKELTDKARQEVRSKYEEHTMAIDCDVTALITSLTTAKEYVEKIDKLIDNDHQSFIVLKSIKIGTRDAEALLQALNNEWKERTIAFNIHKKFKESILQQTTIGRLGKGLLEYEATKLKTVNSFVEGDSFIFGQSASTLNMCQTDSSELFLAEKMNKKLKRLDSNLQYRDMVKLPGEPVAVCQVGVNEVAVRIRGNKEVHLVSVGESMELTSTFTLDGDGWGMTYDAGAEEIYACEDDKISVYSKTGNKLRTYDTDRNGEKIFSACRQIMLGENNQDIYVTDSNKGLIILDKNGSVKKVVKVRGVSDPWLLCQLPGQISLIGGENSGVIAQVDKYGKQLGNLIENMFGVYCAAVYDPRNSRLIVGKKGCTISIYRIYTV